MATMSAGPNYDYDTEQASINKRQKMMEALMMQANAPMDMPAPGGKASPYAALAKILNAYTASTQQAALEKDSKELGARYKSDLADGMTSYVKTRDGQDTMEPSMALKPNEDGSLQQVPVKIPGDPKKAMMEAIASNHPVLQKLGMSLALAKPERDPDAITGKDALSHFEPSSVALNPKDPTKWKKKSDIRSEGGAFFDVGSEGAKQLPGGVSYSDPLNLPGVGVVQGNNATGKLGVLDQAPKTTVNVDTKTVNQGEGSFMKKIGEEAASMVTDARKAKTQGEQTLAFIQKLADLDKRGTFSGPTANLATTLNAMATTMGIPIDENKLANSQGYQAEIAARVSKMITASGGVGRSFTDADAKTYQAQFPQLISTPQGRMQIMQDLKAGADMDINYAKRVEENLRKTKPEAAELFDLAPSNVSYRDPVAPQAPAPAPSSGKQAPLSFEDSMKWLTGGQ